MPQGEYLGSATTGKQVTETGGRRFPASRAARLPNRIHQHLQTEANVMTTVQENSREAGTKPTTNCDAVVLGAGFAGMYMLYRLRNKLGLSVRVYEAGDGVGGTWYWNRYPGARCDSDSYIYCYTFDKELLQEWEWTERYPEQPEILRYLEHVAKRHDLKRDMQFNTRVTGAEFDEKNNLWTVHTDKGEDVTAHYLIAAVGSLSETNIPAFKGL